MSVHEPDLKFVEALVALVEEAALEELVVETPAACIAIKGAKRSLPGPEGNASGRPTPAPSRSTTAASTSSQTGPEAAASATLAPQGPSISSQNNLRQVLAPMTGLYYAAPAPDQPPYVAVGDIVQEGQTLCLIEAMKSFNEVTAELSGQIAAIFATNQQPVTQGQPLLAIRVLDEDGSA